PARSAPVASVLTTGLRFLDRASGDGLPKSAITELITPRPSAGSASLVHALLRAAQQDRHFVALIDGSDSFDPGSSDNSALRHLRFRIQRSHRKSELSDQRSEVRLAN